MGRTARREHRASSSSGSGPRRADQARPGPRIRPGHRDGPLRARGHRSPQRRRPSATGRVVLRPRGAVEMSRRYYPSCQSRRTRAALALGGVRVAERAEQLRARGVEAEKVAILLGVNAETLARYYVLQDELAGAA